MNSPLLTAAEAAKRLGVSASTVRREIAAGRLRAVRIRKLLRVHSDETRPTVPAKPPDP